MVLLMRANPKRLLVILATILVLYFSLVGFWTGFYTKLKIQSYVKNKTGLSIDIGMTYIYPFSGKGFVKNIRLPNPQGFMSKNAIVIEEIRFEGSRKTLYADISQIEKMDIKGIDIQFEPKEAGSNFQKIFSNASTFYHGGESDRDLWFKRMYIGQLNIEPIKIGFGPAILNKSTTLDAVSMQDVGTREEGIGMRDFGQLLLKQYITSIRQAMTDPNVKLNANVSNYLLQWLESHANAQ